MAERRMFAKSIVGSDAFGDMPASSKLLYFNYGMVADDDGFIINPKQIMRMTGATEDDVKVLISKNYIIAFVSGVVVITHWLVHNSIRRDRYKPTQCVEEKKQLCINERKEYYLSDSEDDEGVPIRLPDGKPPDNHLETQVSVGKVRIGKDRLGECKYKLGNESISEETYNTLVSKYGNAIVEEQINRIISHPYYGCLNEKTISVWCEEAINRSRNTKTKNKFHNFHQREYSPEYYEQLERKLLAKTV